MFSRRGFASCKTSSLLVATRASSLTATRRREAVLASTASRCSFSTTVLLLGRPKSSPRVKPVGTLSPVTRKIRENLSDMIGKLAESIDDSNECIRRVDKLTLHYEDLARRAPIFQHHVDILAALKDAHVGVRYSYMQDHQRVNELLKMSMKLRSKEDWIKFQTSRKEWWDHLPMEIEKRRVFVWQSLGYSLRTTNALFFIEKRVFPKLPRNVFIWILVQLQLNVSPRGWPFFRVVLVHYHLRRCLPWAVLCGVLLYLADARSRYLAENPGPSWQTQDGLDGKANPSKISGADSVGSVVGGTYETGHD